MTCLAPIDSGFRRVSLLFDKVFHRRTKARGLIVTQADLLKQTAMSLEPLNMTQRRAHSVRAHGATDSLANVAECELIRNACRLDCRASFGELVRRYQARLVRFLRQRLSQGRDAEDVAQDAFIRAWQALDRFDESRSFQTWLFTIGARLAINHGQASRRRLAAVEEAGQELRLHSGDESSLDIHDDGSLRNVWDLAQHVLTDTERSALWLRYIEECKPQDIATILGRSAINVRVMLHRSRRRLAAAYDASVNQGQVDEEGRS